MNGKEIFFNSFIKKSNYFTIGDSKKKINAEPGDQIVFYYNENDEVVIKVNKKNSLLSLYGSMPPKGETTEKDWSEIREKAKEEMVNQEN